MMINDTYQTQKEERLTSRHLLNSYEVHMDIYVHIYAMQFLFPILFVIFL